LVCIWI